MNFVTRISAQIGLAIIVLAIASLVAIALGVNGLDRYAALTAELQREGRRALAAERMNGLVNAVVMESRGIYMARDGKDAERFAKPLLQDLADMRALTADWRTLIPPEQADDFKALEAQIEDFERFRAETVRLAREVSIPAANEQGNNEINRANRKQLNTVLEKIAAGNRARGDAIDVQLAALQRDSVRLQVAGGTIAVVLGLGLALTIVSRRVARPLSSLAATMTALTKNQPVGEITLAHRRDEIGVMARAVEVFRQNDEKLAAARRAEAARGEVERERIEAVERVTKLVRAVVAAARRGDFSVRAALGPESVGELDDIVIGLNEICATAEHFLASLSGVSGALAAGDLTRRMPVGLEGAFARVAHDMNEAVSDLGRTLALVGEAAGATSGATESLGSRAQDIAGRAASQAAGIEQMTAAVEEFSASLRDTAAATGKMAEAAAATSSDAERAGSIAAEAVSAIERIEQRNANVRDIVGLIDGIAFQTNLLALNAAVEAARAGDHGRGFAVVAAEVRRLAQQSSDASRDIRALIDSATQEIGHGVGLVRDAGTRIERIIGAVKGIACSIGEITQAAREQVASMDQITRTVSALDQDTQRNAADAGASANDALNIAADAERLRARVAHFTVDPAATEARSEHAA